MGPLALENPTRPTSGTNGPTSLCKGGFLSFFDEWQILQTVKQKRETVSLCSWRRLNSLQIDRKVNIFSILWETNFATNQ